MHARGNAVAEKRGREEIRSQPPCKREWPAKLVKILIYLTLVGSGIVFGVIASFNMTRCSNTQTVVYSLGEMLPSPPISSDSIVRISRENPARLEHWIRPPTLMHTISDEELLWRASMVPDREEYPFERVPKIAFMFLTRGPLPLLPFWERFLRGHEGFYSIYVHPQPSFKLDVPSTSPFYRREIPSQVVQWGKINVCDAERRLLANALLDFSNERFILLSESCIPVFKFSTIYNYLIKSKHSFVASVDDPHRDARGRYNKKMAPVVTISQWRKGSQWFEVHRKLAIKIVSDTTYYKLFNEFCTPPCHVMDEHYIQTMLGILYGSLISNTSITWIDWSRGGHHPAMYGKEDITEDLIRRIRDQKNCTYNGHTESLCFMFARKFAPSALKPLLNMSSIVFGFE